MREWIRSHRFMMARRLTQLGILVLYVLANVYGIMFLSGDLSSSLVMKKLPLADPFALLQMFSAGALLGLDVLVGGALILLFYTVVQFAASVTILSGHTHEQKARPPTTV
jgi:ferredoxin-type protein NapH